MSFNEKNNSSLRNTVIIISILGIILCIGSVFCFSRPCIFDLFDLSNKGEIGSAIGGMTAPILNLIGIILIYCSFHEQFKANQIQKEALQQQRKLQTQQQFENNFFQLLANLNSIIHDMDIRDKQECNVKHLGRDCFKYWVDQIIKKNATDLTHNEDTRSLTEYFNSVYKDFKHDLQPYFYNILTILKYIHRYDIENDEIKINLASIRASISENELKLIHIIQQTDDFKELNDLTREYNFWEDFKPIEHIEAKKGYHNPFKCTE